MFSTRFCNVLWKAVFSFVFWFLVFSGLFCIHLHQNLVVLKCLTRSPNSKIVPAQSAPGGPGSPGYNPITWPQNSRRTKHKVSELYGKYKQNTHRIHKFFAIGFEWDVRKNMSEQTFRTSRKFRPYRNKNLIVLICLDSWETKVEAVPMPNWGTGQLREFEAELIPRRRAAACSVVPVSGPSSAALHNGRCLWVFLDSPKFHEIPWYPSRHSQFDEMIFKIWSSRCSTWVKSDFQPRPRQCSTKRHIQSNGCTSWEAASDEAAAR